MTKRQRRIDTAPERPPLTDTPFAALAPLRNAGLPTAPGPAPVGAAPEAVEPYSVRRTRKGGWPIVIEKRASGRVVTVLRQVEGDAAALLSVLRKQCGAGGVLRDDIIELQGDHRDRLNAFLDALKGR